MPIRLKNLIVSLLALFIISFPLGGCATTKLPKVSKAEIKAEKERAKISAFKTYRERQKKLHDIAFPLLVASEEMTEKRRWSYGIIFGSLGDYDKKERNLAQQAFPDLSEKVTVIHLVKGSPAASSGLMVGDIIESYNDKKVKNTKNLVKTLKHLESEERPEAGKFTVLRNDEKVEIRINPIHVADFEVRLEADQMVNAWADGKNITFTYGIMRFTENDDELALIIGHELAHNIEGHIGKAMLQTAATAIPIAVLAGAATVMTGVDMGGVAKIGIQAAQAKFSRDHEREADYVGTYIAARGGYNIDNAPDFWRRFSTEVPKDMKESYDRSHPTSPERTVRMEKVVSEIIDKRTRSVPLLPERK